MDVAVYDSNCRVDKSFVSSMMRCEPELNHVVGFKICCRECWRGMRLQSSVIGIWISLLFGLCGHLVIWVAIYNRLHATAIRRSVKKTLEKWICGAVAFIGLFYVWLGIRPFLLNDPSSEIFISWDVLGDFIVSFYLIACWCAWGAVVIRWGVWRWTQRRPNSVRVTRLGLLCGAHECTRVDEPTPEDERLIMERGDELRTARVQPDANAFPQSWFGDRWTERLAKIPGNQILRLEVNEKEFGIPDLAPNFRGLTIAHASDFHMTGQMTEAFYQHLVEQINKLECDLIALTGDLIDRPKCLPWLEAVFGRLVAPLGKYYVLGNHDCRIADEAMLRGMLKKAGLISPHGQWITVEHRNGQVLLAGNELPWYPGAHELSTPPRSLEGRDALKILLSHSPDQIHWAVDRGFDLMLAGHTHGGQIRPPVVGPIVSPSRFGPKYAGGEFQVGCTHLHVSRGVSGTHPLRFNCLPEITRIRLV